MMSQDATVSESLSLHAKDTRVVFPVQQGSAGYSLRDLTPDEFPAWDSLVSASPQCSLFCRTWWLKAVCKEVRIRGLFKNGSLVAGIPLHSERRYGIWLCIMPRLTQTMGVVMEPLSGKRSSVANRETEILTAFASELVKQRTFFQAFHPTIQNWLPFYWAGFKQTTRLTYVIANPQYLDRVWDNINHSVRSEIHKAEQRGIVVHPCTLQTLLELENKTFARQNLTLPHSADILTRIHKAAVANNAGRCFAAIDPQGKVHCTGFLVWDSRRAYYLVCGGDPALRTSGATSLLAWHLIRFAGQHSQVFDFEGSMLKPVERLFRNFGATAVPYHFIVKCPLWMHTLLLLKKKL